ncbi:DUF6894 family protein [Bradyrhizobium japonicum]|uniref:DUF6894 family protein n=1 Tax=Bradyrhizobium japonicum TaxID=375 RepID=UPI0020A1246F|nr:hypothetical protein [Bradyrhizobium japonicum]MCP1766312.1 hypothetical protein [Bradyrhizobium japonicum]MCP1788450.1 hypothetical protein [Bradyrhizobium japonicum]MCP1810325.1 hypothetical protein [Bradyrhizobium japonicum]MCP1819259.1 hypothetical protein [Bradyrhizobium japonicum]MCP1869231.1 hypothetical protein [Bradyrhizobium japonicum]
MAVYYFDLRDGDEMALDEEGMELRDLVAVQEEAARALAGLSWDAVRNFRGTQSHRMTIEVRDSLGPVMQVKFSFAITRKQ